MIQNKRNSRRSMLKKCFTFNLSTPHKVCTNVLLKNKFRRWNQDLNPDLSSHIAGDLVITIIVAQGSWTLQQHGAGLPSSPAMVRAPMVTQVYSWRRAVSVESYANEKKARMIPIAQLSLLLFLSFLCCILILDFNSTKCSE